ncbi:hypothetical protein KR067_000543 [Drosophila pandora]|nr:hypothetical protein KR067_000543 [Drosophila pandora]
MSKNLLKLEMFINEPMGQKDVTELPGIEDKVGLKLAEAGFDKASTVLGMFLLMKKNRDCFEDWLSDISQATPQQCHDCYDCLSQWCCTFNIK